MEKENAEEKIRQAVLAIRKSRTNPAGRHWLDVAEGFLAQALALSSPHPEAREEDDAWEKCRAEREPVTGSDDWTVGEVGTYRGFFNAGYEAALSRLAAQKDEGQALTVEQVRWLRMVLGRALYRVEHFPEQSNDEGIEADELARAIILIGGEPAARAQDAGREKP